MNKKNGSEVEEYKYDAFISYRHSEMDKFVAERLHKTLETYKPSRYVKKHGTRSKIQRVFRDEEELPLASNLEDPIVRALENTDFLIVVCSPRLKESLWCKKEIETFKKLHGRNNILCVLIEGEPEDSFPEELIYDEVETVLPNGEKVTKKERYEPLAADFRGTTKKEIKKKMKKEILRLLAPIFGVNYDDLKQRHRERTIRRVLVMCALISVAALLFGGYFAYTAYAISLQKDQIEEQANQIKEQALEILYQNEQLQTDQSQSMAEQALYYYENDDRLKALNTAIQAFYVGSEDGSDDITVCVDDAQKALTLASRVYDSGKIISDLWEIEMHGMVMEYVISPGTTRIAVRDKIGYIGIYSLTQYKMETEIYVGGEFLETENNEMGFISDKEFVYMDNEGNIHIYDCETKDDLTTELQATDICVNADLRCIVGTDFDEMWIYDYDDEEIVYSYDSEGQMLASRVTFNEDNTKMIYDEEFTESVSVNVLNLSDYSLQNYSTEGELYLSGMLVGDKLLVLISNGDIFGLEVYLKCYDINEQEECWSQMYSDVFYSKIIGNEDNIFVYSKTSGMMIDTETGSLMGSYAFGSEFGSVKDGGDNYTGFIHDGTFISIDKKTCDCVLLSSIINTVYLSKIDRIGSSYILGIPKDAQNRIVFYGRSIISNASEYDGDTYNPDAKIIKDDDDISLIMKDFKVKDIKSIDYIQYDEDEDYLFVFNYDTTIRIYDLETCEEIGFIDDLPMGSTYFGKDTFGNMYLGDSYKTVSVNPNGGEIAEFSFFHGLTEDRENVLMLTYTGEEDMIMQYPILTLEQIISVAKDQYARYQ